MTSVCPDWDLPTIVEGMLRHGYAGLEPRVGWGHRAGLETDLADGARWAATSRIVEPDPRWTGPTEARYHRFETLMATAATAASDRAAYERSPERPDDFWDDAEAWLSP